MAGLAVTTALVAGSLLAVKCGVADLAFRHGGASGIDFARQLAPGDATYLAREFVLTNNLSYIDQVISLDPYYSWAWIQRGLAAENTGDAALAERYLERAADFDRTFTPRWVLCDFSFRHEKQERFWYWAHQALTIQDADPRGVFRLAWRKAPDRDAVLAKAQIPPGPVTKKFLSFLLEEQPSALLSSPGIKREMSVIPGELKLQFSGAQANPCAVLSQHIPVVPGQREEFRFESRFEPVQADEGLRWRIRDALGAVIAESASLSRISFVSTASPLVNLSLEYERPSGAKPLAGVLILRGPVNGP